MPAHDDIALGALAVIGIVVLVTILISVDAWITMLAWNYVMTYVFGLPAIGYGHSFALTFLFANFATKVGGSILSSRSKNG